MVSANRRRQGPSKPYRDMGHVDTHWQRHLARNLFAFSADRCAFGAEQSIGSLVVTELNYPLRSSRWFVSRERGRNKRKKVSFALAVAVLLAILLGLQGSRHCAQKQRQSAGNN